MATVRRGRAVVHVCPLVHLQKKSESCFILLNHEFAGVLVGVTELGVARALGRSDILGEEGRVEEQMLVYEDFRVTRGDEGGVPAGILYASRPWGKTVVA
jgi:hypothetical protein